MTTPLDTYREPLEKYRQEFEVAPSVKKKTCLSDCFKKKPKHDRHFTQAEIDYSIMIRAKKILPESKA